MKDNAYSISTNTFIRLATDAGCFGFHDFIRSTPNLDRLRRAFQLFLDGRDERFIHWSVAWDAFVDYAKTDAVIKFAEALKDISDLPSTDDIDHNGNEFTYHFTRYGVVRVYKNGLIEFKGRLLGCSAVLLTLTTKDSRDMFGVSYFSASKKTSFV